MLDIGTFGSCLYDVPDGFSCDSCTPDLTSRLTRRNITPPLMPAAAVHSSMVRFAQTGTGTVRLCFPLPMRSAMTERYSRTWKSSILSPTNSARRSPHPMSNATIARSRLPRRVEDGHPWRGVLD